ncbi:MAG: IS1634 family transposase [Azonexus sp.]|jgi:hypothetical protein|nr:IS1634 family transposase [Azonexus sp.]
MSYAVVWFKRDLRIVDHAALAAAARHGPVLCLYIVEPSLWAQPDAARQHYEFILESLRDVYRDLRQLGGRLHVVRRLANRDQWQGLWGDFVTQTPAKLQVIARHKALVDIERGFRVLKSEIEIGPVRYRLPDRIRAHASICFIALILYRIMRQRLTAAHTGLSPERALEQLRRIRHHQIRIAGNTQAVTGISKLTSTQDEVFHALKLKKPTAPQQLALL